MLCMRQCYLISSSYFLFKEVGYYDNMMPYKMLLLVNFCLLLNVIDHILETGLVHNHPSIKHVRF